LLPVDNRRLGDVEESAELVEGEEMVLVVLGCDRIAGHCWVRLPVWGWVRSFP
jgi:hypothetical protein